MSRRKHTVPPGLIALNRAGFTCQAMANILGLASPMGPSKKLRGLSPWNYTEMCLIASSLGVDVAELSYARVADRPLPQRCYDKRLTSGPKSSSPRSFLLRVTSGSPADPPRTSPAESSSTTPASSPGAARADR